MAVSYHKKQGIARAMPYLFLLKKISLD